MGATLEEARAQLSKAQARYKRDFDRGTRGENKQISSGELDFKDPERGGRVKKWGEHTAGPYAGLGRTYRIILIYRGEIVEHVNSDRLTKDPNPAQSLSVDSDENRL